MFASPAAPANPGTTGRRGRAARAWESDVPPGRGIGESDPAKAVANQLPEAASAASRSSATMLVILIIGFTAGPAVSL